jgi:hypothetical protein
MEEDYDILIEILENSVKKNGEIPLTNKHLLNILKLVSKQQDNEDRWYSTQWD